MSKQILGDNPFEEEEPRSGGDGDEAEERAPAGAEAHPDPKSAAGAEPEAGADADSAPGPEATAEPEPQPQPQPPASALAPASAAEPEEEAAGAHPARPAGANGSPGRHTGFSDRDGDGTATQVPDAGVPRVTPSDLAGAYEYGDEDLVLGGEAAVRPGEYGPPIPSVLPDRRSITGEIRELERRVRARLTPAFPIEHRRRLPLEFVWKRYRRFAMRNRADVVDDFGRDPVYSSRVDPILEFLYRRYFRVDAVDIENVPAGGRALLVANHAGALPLDGPMLMHAMRKEHPSRRDLRPLVEDFVFHFPYLGVFMNRIGAVRACQENAERLLEADELVAVFPEGSQGMGKLYRDRYRLQRFGRGGFIKLALRTRSPIVPVAIVGAEEATPMLSKLTWLSRSLGVPYIPITPTFPLLGPFGLFPIPAKWVVRFGKPVDLAADHPPAAAEDRILVNKLAEEVRGRIQGMLDEALAGRRSVLFG